MNKLLSTTALVVALGVPAMAFSQSASTGTQTEAQQQNGMSGGFVTARSQSDLFASELMGRDVYARRIADQDARSNDDQSDATDGQAAAPGAETRTDRNQDMAMMNQSDLDNMEQIGQINEIILSNDGQVRAIVISVGGFLGVGEQDIAVTMDQVSFSTDAEDNSQVYVTVNIGADMLTDAPAYDRTAASTDMSQDEDMSQDGGMSQDGDMRTGFAAPQMERDGYSRIEAQDVSTAMLDGKSVFDTQDNDVGSIDDMLLDEDGTVSHVIVDFGGFLGIGSSQASIGFDELTILTTEDYSDVRVYVDATKAQIQELPRYSARN